MVLEIDEGNEIFSCIVARAQKNNKYTPSRNEAKKRMHFKVDKVLWVQMKK